MIRKISFRDSDHTYKDEEYPYLNWSSLIKMLEPEPEWEFWRMYKAVEKVLNGGKVTTKEGIDPYHWYQIKSALLNNHSKIWNYVEKSNYRSIFHKAENDIKIAWKEAQTAGLEKGSKYHQEQEDKAYQEGVMTIARKSVAMVAQYNYDLWSLPDGAYAELLVYWAPLRLCGTADKVFIETIGDTRYIDIDDYKTNKEIKETRYDKMKSPINHLWANTLVKYQLQISFYAYILSLWGFKVRSTRFTHHVGVIDIPYEFDFMKNEMEDIFEWRRKQLSV